MTRWLALVVVLLTSLPAVAAAAPRDSGTHLTITVYPNGAGSSPVHRYRLVCGPASGTVPRPGRACTALAGMAQPFAPVVVRTCAQLEGGPQEAVVTGVVRGRSISARLNLDGGCQIERWRRVSVVVPGFSDAG